MPNDLGRFEAAREAFRQRAGQQPSYAGIPGGATMANQLTATNPLAPMALRRMEGAGMGPASPPTRPAMQQLQQSAPDEATLIIRALIQRLRSLTPTAPTAPATLAAPAGLA